MYNLRPYFQQNLEVSQTSEQTLPYPSTNIKLNSPLPRKNDTSLRIEKTKKKKKTFFLSVGVIDSLTSNVFFCPNPTAQRKGKS
ncbi:hypothetical protein Glove_208g149 [Diversispora epigaea]|uniref:Uncharacterized protein n=1 Tax=Diversispora epigaea TaxID=1348612 RepID=A0A397IM66_9GLOM|nr:hypothetical protein Glove_208g149 [Diversispora epigaea]